MEFVRPLLLLFPTAMIRPSFGGFHVAGNRSIHLLERRLAHCLTSNDVIPFVTSTTRRGGQVLTLTCRRRAAGQACVIRQEAQWTNKELLSDAPIERLVG